MSDISVLRKLKDGREVSLPITRPLPLFHISVNYRVPSGRRTYYSTYVAANTVEEAKEEAIERLKKAQTFGRRRIGSILGTNASPSGHQIIPKILRPHTDEVKPW